FEEPRTTDSPFAAGLAEFLFHLAPRPAACALLLRNRAQRTRLPRLSLRISSFVWRRVRRPVRFWHYVNGRCDAKQRTGFFACPKRCRFRTNGVRTNIEDGADGAPVGSRQFAGELVGDSGG